MSTALVTGGSRGIGREIVRELIAAGHTVAFTYAKNSDVAEELVDTIISTGGSAFAYMADVRDRARAANVVTDLVERCGDIQILVNNAGIRKDHSLMNMSPEEWNEVIDTNLGGTFTYTKAVLPSMLRHGGSIINMTSTSGVTGMAGQTNYSASKAGIIGFTKALAKEIARFDIRVNAIAPGFIDTEMTSSIEEHIRKKLFSQIPMGKPGTAQEVAKLTRYLAGDDAKYVTGQIWNIDGGLT